MRQRKSGRKHVACATVTILPRGDHRACTGWPVPIGVALLLSLGARPSAQPTSPTIDDLLEPQTRRQPSRRTRRAQRRVHGAGNQLGRQRVRNGDLGCDAVAANLASSRAPANPARSRRGHPTVEWLAFVSDRDGKRQLYRIAIDGGEAERLTNGDEGVNAFAWAPDSERIAFTMTDRDCRQRQGAREAVRRHPHRRRRPPHGASVCHPRQSQRHELGAAIGAHQRRFCGRVV